MDDRIEVWNGIALIKDDTHFTKWVKEHKSLLTDPHHLAVVKKYIPVGGVVIDGGANIGTFTVPYAELVGDYGKVYAYEPNPLAFECLIHNAPANVVCKMLALGVSGFCIVSDESKNHGAAFCCKINRKEIQESTTIVAEIDNHYYNRLDFIKLDIEGWELEALKGATETIKRFHPVLDIEINDATLARMGLTDNDIYSYLCELGYEIVETIGQKPQIDAIFVWKP